MAFDLNHFIRIAKKIYKAFKSKSNKATGQGGQQQAQGQGQQYGGGGGGGGGGAWKPPAGHDDYHPSGPIKPSHQGGAHIGPHHAQNQDQVNASDDKYVSLRNQAIQESNAMKSCFDQAHQAYENGDGAKAKQLSNEGKDHQRRRDELNKQAGDWIYQANNSSSPSNTIDLHGLYVQEAISRAESAIQSSKRSGAPELRIIVGKGIHSKGHVAKIKPAVEDLMRKENLSAHLDPHNAGVIVVDLQGGGGGRRDAGIIDEVKGDDCTIM